MQLQMVTIANAGNLRPGALVTVVPGQPGASYRHPQTATTLTTNARDSAPRLVTQPLPPGMTLVRPSPAILGNTTVMRTSVGASPVGATSIAPVAPVPLTLASLPSLPAAVAAPGSIHRETASPVSFLNVLAWMDNHLFPALKV